MGDKTTDISPDVKIGDLPLTWIRKFLTAILFNDKDKDGVMGRDDHMDVADNIVKAGNLTGESRDSIYKMFQEYCDSASPERDIITTPTIAKQLLTAWKQKDNPQTTEKWLNILLKIFEVLSWDSSGFMTFDNYMVFWNGMGHDKRFARMQFDFLDTNRDGLISKEEFANGFVDYFTNPDENTQNRFFGPLLNY